MKTCTGCEAEMAAEATTCPHCGADQRSRYGRRRNLIATTFLLCLGLSGAGALYLHATGYYNCGAIVFSFAIAHPSVVRAQETCLWQRYRERQRAMLTVEVMGVDTAVTHLFTIDPADQAAPIHDKMTWFPHANTGTATCRAMQENLQMEGCSGNATRELTQDLQVMQTLMQEAQQYWR